MQIGVSPRFSDFLHRGVGYVDQGHGKVFSMFLNQRLVQPLGVACLPQLGRIITSDMAYAEVQRSVDVEPVECHHTGSGGLVGC